MTDELAPFRETIGAEALSEDELNNVYGYLYDNNIPIRGNGFVCHVEFGEDGMTSEVRPISDEAILESMKVPMLLSLRYDVAEIMRHKSHSGFNAHHSDEAQAFMWNCPECDYSWYIDSRSIHERLPEAREAVKKLQRHRLAQPSAPEVEALGGPPRATGNRADPALRDILAAFKPIKKDKEKAERKARQLLFRCLSRDQIRTYKKLGYVKVKGQDGRTYKVESSGYHNVTTVVDGVPHRYCLVCKEDVPPSDTVLAQKLWLETDIEGFLATANLVSPRPEKASHDTKGATHITRTGQFAAGPTEGGITIPPGVEDNLRPWLEEALFS